MVYNSKAAYCRSPDYWMALCEENAKRRQVARGRTPTTYIVSIDAVFCSIMLSLLHLLMCSMCICSHRRSSTTDAAGSGRSLNTTNIGRSSAVVWVADHAHCSIVMLVCLLCQACLYQYVLCCVAACTVFVV